MKAGQAAVRCVACGDRYNEHETGGGPCYVVDDDGRCPCKGFRWVPLEGEHIGSYREPPLSRASARSRSASTTNSTP